MLTHCQSAWQCDDNKDNFLQDNGAGAYSGASVCALSLRMALSAVNILHLNGPLEAKQTQTGLHTNDQWVQGWGRALAMAQCVCRSMVEKQCMCVCVCVCMHLHWTGQERLIVCDMGQEGMGGAAGLMETLCPEGNPLLGPNGCPFACAYYLCVCLCILSHYPSPE